MLSSISRKCAKLEDSGSENYYKTIDGNRIIEMELRGETRYDYILRAYIRMN